MAFAWEQTLIFLWAIVVGAGIMMCYDLFRMLRVAFRQPDGLVFLEDVAFFVLAGLVTWFYLLESCRGELRGFVMIGEGIGALLYFFSLGRLVMAVAKPVIHFMQRIVENLLVRPVIWVWKLASGIVFWIFKRLKKFLFWLAKLLGFNKARIFYENKKKMWQKNKIHLQDRHNVLYNLFVTCFSRRKSGRTSQLENQLQEVDENAQNSQSSLQ